MKYFIGALVATAFWALLFSFIPSPEGKVYDCSVADIHPDFPPKVREECRKKRMENRRNSLVI